MRIDHCILSRKLMKRIEDFKITGHGEMRNGFLGSDHSPIVVNIRDSTSPEVCSNTDACTDSTPKNEVKKDQAKDKNEEQEDV